MSRRPASHVPPPTYGGHEYLEEQNNAAESELHDKVKLLNSLAIDIGDEVKHHNKLLNEANDASDSLGALLGNTIGNVGKLLKAGSRYYLLYLFFFAIFVFFMLWLYI
jgi:blocked-early-in-transport protein 1